MLLMAMVLLLLLLLLLLLWPGWGAMWEGDMARGEVTVMT